MPYTINQLKTPGLILHAKKVSYSIAEKIRGITDDYQFDVIYIAYLFYKLLESGDKKLESPFSLEETAKIQLERFRNGEIPLNPFILNTALTPRIKKAFIKAYKVYEDVGDNADIYASLVVLFNDHYNMSVGRFSSEMSTPDSLVRLVQAILDVQNKDRVADICCGNGNFITKTIDIEPGADYFGYERDIHCAAVLAMKTDILGTTSPSIFMGDVEFSLSDKNIKFDKIFSNYPLGIWFDNYDQVAHTLPFRISRNSCDWYFNNIIIDHLSEKGKAIAIAGAGSTWNVASREARKYFIENGYIEAIINLPGGLMSGSPIPITAYIFSHNNKTIRLVDAGDAITVNDRYNRVITDDNIKEILGLLQNDSERSVVITEKEAKAKDYSLAFGAYSSSLPKYKNGVPISSVAEIIRGTLSPRNNTTTKNTGRYLLQISDLENGSIKKELEDDRFIETDNLSPKQRLLPYDLVISRIGQLPIKAAVVSPNEKRELYPNGNMYVIRIKESTVNPYYLLSFLLSKEGQEALSCISTGSVIKIISVSTLSKLIFPLKDASEQRKIAETISESMAQYEAYTYKADLAKIRIENAYYYNEED